MSRIGKRLSYANVISTLALLLALGGGAVYAASKINGKTIKKASMPGNRLKPNTVTGKQVAEGTLGTVPLATSAGSALSAGTATSADSAGSLGGLTEKVLRGSLPTSTADTPVANVDGMAVSMACDPAGTASATFTPSATGLGRIVQINSQSTVTSVSFISAASISTGGPPIAIDAFISWRQPSGRITQFQVEITELANGLGTDDDCFLQGFARSAP
jgi:hypothetical protein